MSVNNLYPTIRPSLDLNFAGSRTVDPRIDFSRTGTGNIASYFDEKGVMRFAPPNTPRIDFDPVTLECKGLLIEDQRTNLAKYSNQFANSEWTKTRVLLSTDGTLGPNSDSLAYKIYQDTSENSMHVLRITNGSITAGRYYTFSIYIKADAIKTVYIQFRVNGFTSNLGVFFDIENATVTNNQAPSWISARIEKANNGFVRVSISAICTTTYTGSEVVYFHVTNSVGSTSYTGDGVSGLYIWGAQFEEGGFPTSYIPTTSAQVTRAADSVSMQSANFSNWYKQEEGTFLCNYVLGDDNTSAGVLRVTDAVSNEISMRYSSSQSAQVTVVTSGVDQASLLPSGFNTKGSYDRAVSYANNYFQQSINGQLPSTADNTCTIPSVNQLQIGREDNNNFLNGHIKRIAYYPKQFTDQQLQALTT